MNDKIFNIKINEDDFIMLQAMILEHIKKFKSELFNNELDEEEIANIRKIIQNDRILFEKLNVCKLYNEE